MSTITSINRSTSAQTFLLNVTCDFLPSLDKIKDFASGFFKGCINGFLISITVLSLAVIAGIGFAFGQERVQEVFEKISAFRS